MPVRARRRLQIQTLCAAACLSLAACDDGGTEDPADAAPAADTAPAADAGPGADAAPMEDAVAALMAAVDLTRYADDLEFIARGPRSSVDGPHWQATQDRCADAFLAAGLEVTRQPVPGGGFNVIGVLPGRTLPDEHLVLGAHYDSVFDCVGADDNASGVAGVLEAARVLGARRFARTLVFVCFDAEEDGLIGSTDYARRAAADGDDIRGMIALEMIGYRDDTPNSQRLPQGVEFVFPDFAAALDAREGRGDFIGSIGDDDPLMVGHLRAAAEAAGVPLLDVQLDAALRSSPLAADFQRSDHGPFWAAGFPGIMLTDTAEFRNPRYHCYLGEDDIADVDVAFAAGVTAAVVGALAAAAEPAEGEPAAGRTVDPAPLHAPTPVCDPRQGTCDDGTRCAMLPDRLACQPPPAEPIGVDEPCARDAQGGDACAPGLFCTRTGRPRGAERRCRPMCLSTADCDPGQVCPWLDLPASNCVEPCDPFGDDCPEGTRCAAYPEHDRRQHTFVCTPAGAALEGEPCSGQASCAPGLHCDASRSINQGLGCLAFCRPSAADCSPGRTCRPFRERGLPDDLGLCVPSDALVD